MNQTTDNHAPQNPKAVQILAKSLYRQLRDSGYSQGDVLSFASELLTMVSSEVRDKRGGDPR